MRWEEDGIVLEAKPCNEDAVVLCVFTRTHGVHAGFVRASHKQSALYQPGNIVRAAWNARLSEHLGHFKIEPIRNAAAQYFHDYARLSALLSCCGLVRHGFAERQPHPHSYDRLMTFLDDLSCEHWQQAYIRWEIDFLADLGFGLDLTRCAVTGVQQALSHVSPRTGRAVCDAVAHPYAERLLRLPEFLWAPQPEPANENQLTEGLRLTGYFLERFAATSHNKHLLRPRHKLLQALRLE